MTVLPHPIPTPLTPNTVSCFAMSRRLHLTCPSVRVFTGFCLCLPSLLTAAPLHAQIQNPDISNKIAINDVIISLGTRRAVINNTAPYAMAVLTQADLQANAPRTLPEALGAQTGILIQKTAAGHGSPYIRGFTGNRTLCVIDGIVYNNASYRDGPNEYFSHIDILTLEQIELLRGPASTLYGSQAVGGTIALQTKPSHFDTIDADHHAQTFWRAAQSLRASSGDHSLVARSTLDFGRTDQWGVLIGASFKDYDDVRAADLGRLPHTRYSETGFDIRLDANLTETISTSLVHQTLTQDDVWRTHSTLYSVPFITQYGQTLVGTDQHRSKDQNRAMTALHLTAQHPTPWIEQVKISAAHQPRRERETRIRQNGQLTDQGFDSDLWSLSSVMQSTTPSLSLTYGFDLSQETLNSDRTDTDPITNIATTHLQGPIGDEARYSQAGAFMTAEQNFAFHDHDINIELGGRASWVKASVGQFEDPFSHVAASFENSWSNMSGNLRASSQLTDSIQIWASASTAFRAPNIADISRFGGSRSDEIEVASLNLKPETFKSLELGLRWTGGNSHIALSGYVTDLKDYIDTVTTGNIRDGLREVAKQNAASGRVSGVEIEGEYFLSSAWRLHGNAAYVDGKLTGPDGVSEPLSRLMPFTVNAGLEWKSNHLSVVDNISEPWWRLDLTHNDHADRLSSGDIADTQRIPIGGTPAFTVLSTSVGANWGDHLRFSLHANNLLDSAYRTHGSGSNEAGRHIMASLHYEFGS